MAPKKSRVKQELLAYILGLVLWLPILFLLSPIYLLFFFYSKAIHKIAKKFHPDLIPITKIDSFLAFSPSRSPFSYSYTCQVLKVKGELDLNSIRNHFNQTFFTKEEEKYLNLYCYFVNYLGYTFKKRVKSLDLDYHIQAHELGEETLEGFVGRWMVEHDSDLKPEWMVKLIHEKDHTWVIFKLHHGLCDGYTIVNLLGKLTGEKAPYLFKEAEPPLPKLIKCFIQTPFLLAKLWTELAKSCKNNLARHIPPGPETWLISFSSLSLETIKEIRRATNTNFVSVLMSIQIGALKRLVLDLAKDRDEVERIENTFIGHSMGWPKHPVMTGLTGMANHLTVNTIKVSLQIQDPLERLLLIDNNFRQTKSNGYPIMSFYTFFNIVKLQPSWLSTKLISQDLSIMGVETGLSTLLCSPNRHFLLGKQLENIYLPVLTHSTFPRLKLMTVPVSHSGILDISVNASTALVKNQEMLDRLTKTYFPHELEELKNRVGNIVY